MPLRFIGSMHQLCIAYLPGGCSPHPVDHSTGSVHLLCTAYLAGGVGGYVCIYITLRNRLFSVLCIKIFTYVKTKLTGKLVNKFCDRLRPVGYYCFNLIIIRSSSSFFFFFRIKSLNATFIVTIFLL